MDWDKLLWADDAGVRKITGAVSEPIGSAACKPSFTFLLKKLQEDNCNLIASKDDNNLNLIQGILQSNKFNLEVEDYNNIERGPDLCYYSKSTKKVVTIIDVTKRDENNYYISYYIGPEGGASKEIQLEKRNGKWIILNDDGMWNVK